MSEDKRSRAAIGGAFVHEPTDSPTPEPAGSLADLLRRVAGRAPYGSDSKQDRGLNKQVRFLLEMFRAATRRGAP
jgi:hypothetical protein